MPNERGGTELDLTQPADDVPDVPTLSPSRETPPGFPYARLRSIVPFAVQTELHKDVTLIGRSDEADCPLGLQDGAPVWNRQISKKHCEIHRKCEIKESQGEKEKKQTFFIKDTSLNGTFINGRRLEKDVVTPLHFGDVIAFGENIQGLDFNVYIFSDLSAEAIYPFRLKETYIMTGVLLGKGGYGNVELGRLRSDCSQAFAIKELHKEKFAANYNRRISKLEDIKNEANLMMQLSHPNIVLCMDWLDAEDSAYLVMEYVGGGEFFSLIVDARWEKKGLGDAMGRFYAFQLITAVGYLHERGICHRDIKPENILLVDNNDYTIAKLTDFGLAKSKQASTMKTYCGTPCYIAPEIAENECGAYLPLVDIWSLGVVLFTAFSGYPPFSADYEDMPLNEQIKKGRLIFLKHWNNINVSSQEAILRMLQVQTLRRASAKELLGMDWMQGAEAKKAQQMVEEYARNRVMRRGTCLLASQRESESI